MRRRGACACPLTTRPWSVQHLLALHPRGDLAEVWVPDYSGLPNFDGMGYGYVTIPAGSSTAVITLTPIDDATVESSQNLEHAAAPLREVEIATCLSQAGHLERGVDWLPPGNGLAIRAKIVRHWT